MNNRCAIFMRADPLMKKDIETVKHILQIYQNVDILLDRKWQKDNYTLSFSDRADIIRHDFAEAGISEYRILPNDTSRHDQLVKERIKNVAVELNFHSQIQEMYDRHKIAKQIVPDVNIVMIPQFSDDQLTSQKMLFDLIEEDHTHQLYKKYISEYAYIKLKLKLMTKIGITGNRGCGLECVLDIFRERDYDVIDVDQMLIEVFKDPILIRKFAKLLQQNDIKLKGEIIDIGLDVQANIDKILKRCLEDENMRSVCQKFLYDQLYMNIAKVVLKSSKKVIVIGSTLLFELKMDWMFNYLITVSAPELVQRERMKKDKKYSDEKIDNIMRLHMNMQEKVKRSDYFIDATDGEDAIARNTINLINKKLEARF